MVAAVQSFRLCARACSRAPASRRIAPRLVQSRRTFSSTRAWRADEPEAPPKSEGAGASTSATGAPKQNLGPRKRSDKVVLSLQEGLTKEEKEAFRRSLALADDSKTSLPARWRSRSSASAIEAQADRMDDYMAEADQLSPEEDAALKDVDLAFNEFDEVISEITKPVKVSRNSFWGEDEEDQDYLTEDIDEDDFSDEDIMSMAHGKLEEHREFREYARIAAWQMPLLSSES